MTKIQWILLLVFLLAAGAAAVITILLRRKRQQNTEKPETMDNLTDFHCHILPGVDDGSEDMDMTLEMLDLSYAQGVRRIIATPHSPAIASSFTHLSKDSMVDFDLSPPMPYCLVRVPTLSFELICKISSL